MNQSSLTCRYSNVAKALKAVILTLLMIMLWQSALFSQGNFPGSTAGVRAGEATWIWYPGDYAIWLANKMQNRRTERGSFLPVFWKMDSHYVLVEFHKDFELKAPERVRIAAEGRFNIKIDGKALTGSPENIVMPSGKHRLSLKVFNQANVPAVFVSGDDVKSDSSWKVTFEDKEWIDASGKASDKSGTIYQSVGYWNFNSALQKPSQFHLRTKQKQAVKKEFLPDGSILLDFGQETFGYVRLKNITGKGVVRMYYGESREEALSRDSCETLDTIMLQHAVSGFDTMTASTKAFRYVQISTPKGLSIDDADMLYEYAPVTTRGSFSCSDTLINKIWQVANYTLHLNTREFFIDGIKRDRWIWSGDAYQSYLMNYYLFFDQPTVKRTLYALRGKDPVTSHINTIMDYSFYWFMGVKDYFEYTGDSALVRTIYPKMVTLMDYCLSRRNKDGFMEGLPGDWVFIDWADHLTKQGALSFEQLLFCQSLKTMAICARVSNDLKGAAEYSKLSNELTRKLFDVFWDQNRHAFIHSDIGGRSGEQVFRYTNMFALLLGYLDSAKQKEVVSHVLLNKQVQAIHTPYMRFYELEALCAAGKLNVVTGEMRNYWGGMLARGATSFWEQYDPAAKGAAQYAMYGRPFGKSLCHAWGASPIYLLGKYYLGVKPTSPGYQTYEVRPQLGGLKWIKGTVPSADGDIQVYCDAKKISVKSSGIIGVGTLIIQSKTPPTTVQGTIRKIQDGLYKVEILPDQQYVVNYVAM
ncbi:alpha-L-rhamnosidase [Arachidicoccus rhizosphaerae]|uniref:Alpha-L-rhamnosidase n=1 Tax=Arachidicoccus rhizosphaerae TaxID=551991 RepID=A0A1H3X073_9BACT|nr:alpha-L-rhamnosidase C-terminal domain-containing protein [Arachidicoccus rhizosphaerae]SDZ92777.1 alpha-L-rhamnosidase [Arachidicoccus rhizosphaerae]